MQILVATDFSTRSQRAVRRAGLLARETSGELALVHVVESDQPAELIALERREAERILNEQILGLPELRDIRCNPLVRSADAFEGILRAAEETQADFVVMGSHRKQLLQDIFIGTTIERVIRKGSFPVLMVNGEVARPYRTALAGVDMSEAAAIAIRTAQRLKLLDVARLTLVHAFLPLGKGHMSRAGLREDTIRDYEAQERARAKEEAGAFLRVHSFDDRIWPLHVEQGAPAEVIAAVAKTIRADLVVIGTHGRSGFASALLGSVAQEVLRSIDIDVLVVPPTR